MKSAFDLKSEIQNIIGPELFQQIRICIEELQDQSYDDGCEDGFGEGWNDGYEEGFGDGRAESE